MSETQRLESQADADALLARFAQFYDSRVVGFSYENPGHLVADRIMRVVLEARTTEEGAWHRVRFTISGADSWLFAESWRGTNLVLSLGMGIHFRDDGIFFDFSPWTERPWTEEYIQRSNQYVLGASCEIEIEPI